MVNVKTEIQINCPIQTTVAYSTDPDNAPQWYDNIKSVNWKTAKPLSIGSQIAFVAHFMGRQLSYTYEVIEMNDKRFIMKTAEGPIPMKTTYEWEFIEEGITRMTLFNEGNPSGISRLIAPLMEWMMKIANRKDLKKLKTILDKGNY